MTGDGRRRLLDAADRLKVWQRGDERAPHKPLLLLLMLGRLHAGGPRLVAFPEVEDELRGLLRDFGPPRTPRPDYPFWHLQSDGIWEIPRASSLGRRPADTPPLRLTRTLEAGLPGWAWRELRSNPRLVDEIAERLLLAHFPASLHDDILERVNLPGLRTELVSRSRRRDPQFRLQVLRAYEYRCAMCGYDGRLDQTPVGLDAAHIRWWAADGPDKLDNAMALCVLHHKAFDLGAVGLTGDLRIAVSGAFHGGRQAHESVSRLAGAAFRGPQPGLPRPAEHHRRWHEREVFRLPSRHMALAADEQAPYA